MASKNVLGAAGATGAATLISRVLGLVREQVFAILFGASHATDAFNIAFRIPNLLRDLFAEGAMSAALVPTFVGVREKSGKSQAWRLAGLVFRVLFFFVGFLALIGMWFAPELVELYASAYREVPGKFELTVRMTQIIFPFFPLVALAAAFMGVLNACGVFFIPAFSSALFNLVSVVTGVGLSWLAPSWGYHPIEGMAVGVVFGGAIQAFSQLPSLYRVGYRWQPRGAGQRWYRDPGLRRIVALMGVGTVGLAATQINILVSSILATREGAGAVSWINYAFRLMQFPIGVFGVSLAVATTPRVSEFWIKKDFASARAVLERSARQVMAINFPAAAGLAFLSVPIIQLIFEYGQFQASDTYAAAQALAAFSTGLVFYSLVKVFVPICYAIGRTRVAVASSVLSVGVNIALSFWFVGLWGFWGLALATSLAAVFNGGFLLFFVSRRFVEKQAGFSIARLSSVFAVQLGLALAMGAICWQSHRYLIEIIGNGTVWVRLLGVGAVVAEGVLVVWLLARILGIRDSYETLEFFLKKVKFKLSSRAK